MTVAAPSNRTFRRVALPGRRTLWGHVAVPQPLAIAFQDATGLTSMYVRACLRLWNWLVVSESSYWLIWSGACSSSDDSRLAIRLGAATPSSRMQATETRPMLEG